MSTKTNAIAQTASLAMLAALALAPLGARADDGAYGLPARNAQAAAVTELGPAPMTCKQALVAAWFVHELERSDGSVIPALDTPRECDKTMYASPEALTPRIARRLEDRQGR